MKQFVLSCCLCLFFFQIRFFSLSFLWQTYIRNYVDTLAPRIREANRVGQNLIQSAAPRVSTNQLERDLEAMNDRWNKLKTTVSSNGYHASTILVMFLVSHYTVMNANIHCTKRNQTISPPASVWLH